MMRDDECVLDKEFCKWKTKCEMRADPVSVALHSDVGVAQLKNVCEISVRSQQVCTDCTEQYECKNYIVSSTVQL